MLKLSEKDRIVSTAQKRKRKRKRKKERRGMNHEGIKQAKLSNYPDKKEGNW
jgi:hypothetical protein